VDSSDICVVLNYGPKSDWVRNVLAAGSGAVIHQKRRHALTDPQILSVDSPELPDRVRSIGGERVVLRGALTEA
jgi:hypothetical protein